MSRVVAVGNCGFDQSSLSGWLSREFAVKCTPAHDWEDLQAELTRGDVAFVIVNRVLDRDGSEGLDVLRRLKSERRFADVPTMLLSNYPEAQAEAVAMGAVQGFGKRELGGRDATETLRPYLEEISTPVAH